MGRGGRFVVLIYRLNVRGGFGRRACHRRAVGGN